MSIQTNIRNLLAHIPAHVSLVAVSKNNPPENIMQAYLAGQRIFGENKVQELLAKQPLLPADICWHMLGHLQTNKVKYIAPFIGLIHSVDSLKLLKEIDNEAMKNNRIIDCLLEFHIAGEETKFGLSDAEARDILSSVGFRGMQHVRITGVMGMASFTDDEKQIREEFKTLKSIYNGLKQDFFCNNDYFREISMGMSNDYLIAVEEGSTMLRIGTAVFGERIYL